MTTKKQTTPPNWLQQDMEAKPSGAVLPALFALCQKLKPELESDYHTGAWGFSTGKFYINCSPWWEADNLEECKSIEVEVFEPEAEDPSLNMILTSIPFTPLETIEASAAEWNRLMTEWVTKRLMPKTSLPEKMKVDHDEAAEGVFCGKCDKRFEGGEDFYMVKDESPTGQHGECVACVEGKV